MWFGIIPTFIHKIYLCIFFNFMNIFIFNPYYWFPFGMLTSLSMHLHIVHTQMQIQEICKFIPCASPCQSQDCSADAIHLKNLVVSKVQSLLHLSQEALLHQVIAIAATRFATHTVCNKWLVVITITGLILLHHFIILIKNNHPVPKQQVVWFFQKQFVRPKLVLCCK